MGYCAYLRVLLVFTPPNIHSCNIARRRAIGGRKSKLRVPCCPVRRLERPLAPVPEERAQLEPLLSAAVRVDGALVAEIDVLANGEALGVLVGQDDGPAGLGLAHDVGRARVVEEAVVDAARVPGVDAPRAAEGGVANQGVPAAVEVSRVVVCAEVVLLGLRVRKLLQK